MFAATFQPRFAALSAFALTATLLGTPALAGPWVDEQGHFTPLATQAARALADSAQDGLDPADYDGHEWLQRVRAGTATPDTDTAFNQSALKYLHDLHDGRIDPLSLGEKYDGAKRSGQPAFDAEAVLQQAVASGSFDDAVRAATPHFPMYASLRSELARYQKMAADPALAAPLPPVPAAGVRPGQRWAGVAALRARLAAMGDLSGNDALPDKATTYTSALQAGVRSFQERVDLPATGVLTPATLKQLNVPPAERVRQIGMAMERMRWTPLEQGERMIVVNVPEFRLRAYTVADGKPDLKLSMKVIVGRALNTRTPLFDEDMRFIEFSPYWNVPPSIAKKELLPKATRDPGYLARNDFEIVGTGGLAGVAAGTARIRQKPGPKNALGDIKFVFPNNENIYLHHTPSTGLFGRDRRDLSHGCVRVEQPLDLAKFVLQEDPAWPEERIRKAMDAGKSQTIRLKQPVPVLITYSTTVMRDGKLHFLPDLYQHDAKLAQALQQRKN